MFDIGFSELVAVGLIALIVLGPKRLPEVARTAGRWMGQLRRFIADVKQDIKDAKANLKECTSELNSAKNDKERRWAEQAIARAEANVNEAELSLANAVRDFEAFKSDKRPYLMEYVNREMFGDDSSQA